MLLFAWLVPGLHTLEFIFGMAHGLGWFLMCALTLAAVRARVIPLRLGVAVAIIGAVGPFVGSYEFVREERRRGAAHGCRRMIRSSPERGAPRPSRFEVEIQSAPSGARTTVRRRP